MKKNIIPTNTFANDNYSSYEDVDTDDKMLTESGKKTSTYINNYNNV